MPIILTCDVEDWLQASSRSDTVSHRCVDNVQKVVDFLDLLEIKATFFVQGMVAKQYPEVVRTLHQKAHDIQTHGFSHKQMHRLSRKDLRQEIVDSKDIIEQITGQAITGFRAPEFSITKDNFWVFDVLLESGFCFDSSIFPMRMRRYGISRYRLDPHIIKRDAGKIVEFPLCVFRKALIEIPLGGGGYLRLFPFIIFKRLFDYAGKDGRICVLYIHPYEFRVDDFKGWESEVPFHTRFFQSLGRSHIENKLTQLLKKRECTTMALEADRILHCKTLP